MQLQGNDTEELQSDENEEDRAEAGDAAADGDEEETGGGSRREPTSVPYGHLGEGGVTADDLPGVAGTEFI